MAKIESIRPSGVTEGRLDEFESAGVPPPTSDGRDMLTGISALGFHLPIELVLLPLAFWHSLTWYVLRSADISDEPWGLVSLSTVGCFIASSWNRRASFLSTKLTVLAVALMVLYAITFQALPPLPRCMIAFLTVGVVVWNRSLPEKRNLIAMFGLLLLSSPLLASLQFFVGFPLRLLVTKATAAILLSGGTTVSVAGTAFEHQGRMILVDSPCSGINMMWAGFYLCFVLCWTKRITFSRSLLLLAITVLSVITTNVARTTTLVYLDILKGGGQNIPDSSHDAVGLASFVSLALTVVFIGNWLGKTRKRDTTEKVIAPNDPLDETPATLASAAPVMPTPRMVTPAADRKPRTIQLATVSFVVASMVAGLIPFFQKPYHENFSKDLAADWPDRFEGHALKPIKLSSTETKFSSGFPGRIAKFTDGTRTILFRKVNKPTRQLHPSSDCYRGNSFQLHPMAALRDTNGQVWSRFKAQKSGCNLEVREIVFDSRGHTWSDTSSWYWSALLGKTQSPWLAITVASVSAPNQARPHSHQQSKLH